MVRYSEGVRRGRTVSRYFAHVDWMVETGRGGRIGIEALRGGGVDGLDW